MLQNYLKTAFRSLLRQKWYAVINIVGLAVCAAAACVVLLYVRNELTYDTHHTGAERTFRALTDMRITQEKTTSSIVSASFAEALQRDFPREIELVQRCSPPVPAVVRAGNVSFAEDWLVSYADSAFLAGFSFPVLYGDAASALALPNSIVLTESLAKKYFGRTNVVGEILSVRMNNQFAGIPQAAMDLHITAVMRDLPSNTSFHFGILIPFAKQEQLLRAKRATMTKEELFTAWYAETFIRFREGVNVVAMKRAVEQYMEKIFLQNKEKVNGNFAEWKKLQHEAFLLQALSDIHLNTSGIEGVLRHNNVHDTHGDSGTNQYSCRNRAGGLVCGLYQLHQFSNSASRHESA